MRFFYSAGKAVVCIFIYSCFTLGTACAQLQAESPQLPAQPRQKPIIPLSINPQKDALNPSLPLTADPFINEHADKSSIFLLYDISIKLHEDWSFTSKVHKKIKILKKDSKHMGEIPIPYRKSREKITDIEACSITPDGKRHNYSKIQDIKIYKNLSMYSDSRVKVITLPEVNIGSVLEYKAMIHTRKGLIKNAFWDAFDFHFGIPAKEVNYTVTFPKKLDIRYKEFDLEHKPAITETDSTITYSWRLENLYNESEWENYLPPPSVDDVYDTVEFSSIKSWKDISDWYYGLVNKNLKVTPGIKRAAHEAVEGRTGLKNKVRGVLEYIQDNFRYVSMSFGDNALEPHPTDEVFRNKYGDCKDLSLLCLAMLKTADITSYMALFGDELSMTDPKQDLPFPTLFDHVLLLVKDKEGGDFYIDPLLDGYDIGEYPFSYQKAYTFVITENGGKFGRLPVFDDKRSCTNMKKVIEIRPDGSALLEVDSLWSLEFSLRMRDMMKAMDDSEKSRFFEILDIKYGKVLDRRWDNMDGKYGPVKSYIKYEKEDMYPITDDMLIIDVSDGEERDSEFTKKERENPIFFPNNALNIETITYILPEGFKVAHMPKDLSLGCGFSSIERRFKKRGNKLTVTATTRFFRKELPPEEYPKIKAFYDEFPKKSKQRIILKKVKPWHQQVKDFWHNITKA